MPLLVLEIGMRGFGVVQRDYSSPYVAMKVVENIALEEPSFGTREQVCRKALAPSATPYLLIAPSTQTAVSHVVPEPLK